MMVANENALVVDVAHAFAVLNTCFSSSLCVTCWNLPRKGSPRSKRSHKRAKQSSEEEEKLFLLKRNHPQTPAERRAVFLSWVKQPKVQSHSTFRSNSSHACVYFCGCFAPPAGLSLCIAPFSRLNMTQTHQPQLFHLTATLYV